MFKASWPAAAFLLVMAAGCGGGGSSASSGAGPLPTPIEKIPFEPIASAKLDVDVVTGKVTVTPLRPQDGGRAIWGGDKIEVQSTNLLAIDGQTATRSINLKLRNNSNESIGVGTGLRVQFRELSGVSSADFREKFDIATVAGNGVNASTDGPALTSACTPHDIDFLPDGSILILEPLGLRRLRNGYLSGVTSSSIFTLSGGLATAVDPATQKPFAFVADQNGHRVRWVDVETGANGILAGTGVPGDVVGAPATAQFNSPRGLEWDGSGLLVADSANGKVKRVPVAFVAGAPVASTVTAPYTGLSSPTAVAFNGTQTAVTEQGANRVRIYRVGSMTFGSGVAGFLSGTAATARFNGPCGLAWAGNVLYVSNSGTGSVSAIWQHPDADPNDPDSYAVALIAGTGIAGFTDGAASAGQFSTSMTGLAARGAALYCADRGNRRLRMVDTKGPMLDAGFGAFNSSYKAYVANASGQIGPTSTTVRIPYIARQTVLAPGQWTDFGQVDFQTDTGLDRFTVTLLIEATSGTDIGLDSVMNNGLGSGSPNNYVQTIIPTNPVAMDGPLGMAVISDLTVDMDADAEGSLYILDGRTVRRFDAKTQVLSTIAGVPNQDGTVDGSGLVTRFELTSSIAVSATGDLILVAQTNHVIRALVYNGFGSRNDMESYTCTTVLGLAGTSGNILSVGTDTRLNAPRSVGISEDGRTAVIADAQLGRGILVTIAGPPNNPLSYRCQTIFAAGGGLPVWEVDIDTTGGVVMLMGNSGVQPSIFKSSVTTWSNFTLVTGAAGDNDSTATAYAADALATDSLGRVLFVSKGAEATPRLRVRRISSNAALVHTVAGTGLAGSDAAGPSDKFLFRADAAVLALAVSRDGTAYLLAGRGGISRISRIVR